MLDMAQQMLDMAQQMLDMAQQMLDMAQQMSDMAQQMLDMAQQMLNMACNSHRWDLENTFYDRSLLVHIVGGEMYHMHLVSSRQKVLRHHCAANHVTETSK